MLQSHYVVGAGSRKSWTIGKRIVAGFSALLLIAAALGLVAVVGMRKTHVEVGALRRQNVPNVSIANQIERDVLQAMYQVRVYGETEDISYLQNGRSRLRELQSHISGSQTARGARTGPERP
ncbi:MAG TPA: hypothetical protein VHB20_12910 [Verrucomicrobiae bacterium]|nr:hypothetical protein [Verrucomicrobiae bacterium]